MGSEDDETTGLEELFDEPAAPAAEAASDKHVGGGEKVDERTAEQQASIEEALEKIDFFAGLLPVHIHRISSLSHVVDLKKNDYVFRHGDEGDGLYIIVTGAVRISRTVPGMGEEALAVLKDGAHFGEMAIIEDDVPRSADAIAHEKSQLIKLPKDDLHDLMFVDRELAYELLWRFVRELSKRLRESNDKMMMLSVSSKF